ncbi:MAG: hypothetical protein L6Q98_20180 [Anaerolineae bacterium]|nr:hypothetical protein [Anaerolineae bacterium]NUQ05764.1 hypothetical protein [Anaerolineae bacterium]
MRRLLPGLVSLISLVLLLAACAGEPTPTATPESPTAEPTQTPILQGQATPLLPTGIAETLVQALPGTLVNASTVETPGATPRAAYTLRLVSYYQQGGITGTPLSIVLYGDGRLIRDGVESRVGAEAIEPIAAMLTAMDFLTIEGIFTSAGRAADLFQYTVTVETQYGSKTLSTQDGMTPDPLLALYAALRALGQEPAAS